MCSGLAIEPCSYQAFATQMSNVDMRVIKERVWHHCDTGNRPLFGESLQNRCCSDPRLCVYMGREAWRLRHTCTEAVCAFEEKGATNSSDGSEAVLGPGFGWFTAGAGRAQRLSAACCAAEGCERVAPPSQREVRIAPPRADESGEHRPSRGERVAPPNHSEVRIAPPRVDESGEHRPSSGRPLGPNEVRVASPRRTRE